MKTLLLMLFVIFNVFNSFDIETLRNYGTTNDIDDNYAINSELDGGVRIDSDSYITGDYISRITRVNSVFESNYNSYTKSIYGYKREYNYLYYTVSDNYNVTSLDDIKNSIFNGLNDGKDIITLYCSYSNNDDCLNDFYSVYKNKVLMSSINNYVSPYNKYSSLRYRVNINDGNMKIMIDVTKKYTDDQIVSIDERLDDVLGNLDLSEMSDVEKIKWAHDFIVSRNRYDNDALADGFGDSYSAYGAIVGDKAICQGYTEAMAIILDRFNIPNIMISSGAHIWNLVNVNGKWLHLDATWDDPIFSSGKEAVIYDYYLVTSDELYSLDDSRSHVFDSSYYLESFVY